MYTYEFFLYHLKRYGTVSKFEGLPEKVSWTEVIKQHELDLITIENFNKQKESKPFNQSKTTNLSSSDSEDSK